MYRLSLTGAVTFFACLSIIGLGVAIAGDDPWAESSRPDQMQESAAAQIRSVELTGQIAFESGCDIRRQMMTNWHDEDKMRLLFDDAEEAQHGFVDGLANYSSHTVTNTNLFLVGFFLIDARDVIAQRSHAMLNSPRYELGCAAGQWVGRGPLFIRRGFETGSSGLVAEGGLTVLTALVETTNVARGFNELVSTAGAIRSNSSLPQIFINRGGSVAASMNSTLVAQPQVVIDFVLPVAIASAAIDRLSVTEMYSVSQAPEIMHRNPDGSVTDTNWQRWGQQPTGRWFRFDDRFRYRKDPGTGRWQAKEKGENVGDSARHAGGDEEGWYFISAGMWNPQLERFMPAVAMLAGVSGLFVLLGINNMVVAQEAEQAVLNDIDGIIKRPDFQPLYDLDYYTSRIPDQYFDADVPLKNGDILTVGDVVEYGALKHRDLLKIGGKAGEVVAIASFPSTKRGYFFTEIDGAIYPVPTEIYLLRKVE